MIGGKIGTVCNREGRVGFVEYVLRNVEGLATRNDDGGDLKKDK
jgi:hypothetical protein